MCNPLELYKTSIGKKQIVAVTGLLLILYVIVHLAGNLLIFAGPAVFNGYAQKLASLRPALYVVEVGLLFIFVVHIWTTAVLVIENYGARGQAYAVYKSRGERSLATRLMPYTGTFLLAFVAWHIFDFTLIDHDGARSILLDGKSYGLFGVVYNSFLSPLHSALYVLAMFCLGLHLSHGVASCMQTTGFNHPHYAPAVKRISNYFAFFVTVGYSLIPVSVQLNLLRY